MTNVLEILKNLVSYKTTADNPDEVRSAYQYIESLFVSLPVEFKYFEENKKVSQLVFPKGSNWEKSKILLNGHIDVVPAKFDSDFNLRVEGDKAYGRGTADMKGGIAAMLYASLDLAKAGVNDWALLLTSDEEIGGANGVGHIADKYLRPEFVLVADGPRMEGLMITVKEKGGVWLELKAKGKSAHGARPWLGENAIRKVLDAVAKVHAYTGEIEPDKWKTTINLASVETSNKTPNVVPDDARAILDIRFTEATALTPSELVEKIRKLVPEVEVNGLTNVAMLHNDEKNPKIQLLQKIFEETAGVKTPFTFGHGASDARYFSALGIPAVLVGAVGGNWHSEDEWASVKSLEAIAKVVRSFVERLG